MEPKFLFDLRLGYATYVADLRFYLPEPRGGEKEERDDRKETCQAEYKLVFICVNAKWWSI